MCAVMCVLCCAVPRSVHAAANNAPQTVCSHHQTHRHALRGNGIAVVRTAAGRFASGVPWEPLLEVDSPSMHSRLHLLR
jgi:hypothetical protein